MLRVSEELLRLRFFENLAFVDEDHAVCNFLGKAHFMSYDYHGHAFSCQCLHEIENFADHFRVESGCGLVEEDYVGIHGKGADDGNSLLLTAGQRGGIYIRFVFQSDASEQFEGVFVGVLFDRSLVSGDFDLCFLFLAEEIGQRKEGIELLCFSQILKPDMHGCEHDVLDNSLVVEQVELLEYHADFASVNVDVNAHVRNVNAAEDDGAAGGVFHTVETAEESTLTASGRTQHAHDVALVDFDINTAEDFLVAEIFLEINYVDHFFSIPFPSV